MWLYAKNCKWRPSSSLHNFSYPSCGIKKNQNLTFCLKSIVSNHFNVNFEQYKCLPISFIAFTNTFRQIKNFIVLYIALGIGSSEIDILKRHPAASIKPLIVFFFFFFFFKYLIKSLYLDFVARTRSQSVIRYRGRRSCMQGSAKVNQGSSCSGMPVTTKCSRKNSWPKCSALIGVKGHVWVVRGQPESNCPEIPKATNVTYVALRVRVEKINKWIGKKHIAYLIREPVMPIGVLVYTKKKKKKKNEFASVFVCPAVHFVVVQRIELDPDRVVGNQPSRFVINISKWSDHSSKVI